MIISPLLLEALNLAAGSDESEVIAEVVALRSQLNIAHADLAATELEVAGHQTARLATAADSFISDALSAGKIAPAHEDEWRALFSAKRDTAIHLMANRREGSSTPVGSRRQTREVVGGVEKLTRTTETSGAIDQALAAQGTDPKLVRQYAAIFGVKDVNKTLAAMTGTDDE